MNSGTEEVKLAVERSSGQVALYLEDAPVVETFNGETLWKGIVEIYALRESPYKAYGWVFDSNAGKKYVAVLNTPPVDSPISAVRAWIVSQFKK